MVTAENSDANDKFSKWRERGETENEGEEEEEEEEEEEARGHCFEIRGTRSKRCPPPDKRYGKIFTTDGLANDFVTLLPVKMNAIILTN